MEIKQQYRLVEIYRRSIQDPTSMQTIKLESQDLNDISERIGQPMPTVYPKQVKTKCDICLSKF